MTDNKVTQLKTWYDAAKTAFRMGVRRPDNNLALLLAMYARLRETSPDDVSAFLDDLAQENRMYELIRKRFTPALYPHVSFDEDIKIYIAHMAVSPGDAVQAMTFLYLSRCIHVKDMVLNFLPSGYPGPDALGMIWALQKHDDDFGSDNLLDRVDTVNGLYNKMHGGGVK